MKADTDQKIKTSDENEQKRGKKKGGYQNTKNSNCFIWDMFKAELHLSKEYCIHAM